MAGEGLERVPADHKASGYEACLELAKECVAEIEKGRVRYFASVMCESAGHVDAKHGGSTGCEFAALAGLEMIRDALKRPSPGPANASAAATIHLNYACYDLHRAPLSFDFAPWLVDREMVRVRFGAPGPLRVAFTEPDPGRVMSENNLLMLEKVIMPMVEMIGGVIDPVAVTSRARAEFYCNRPIVDAAKAGETVPMLRPNAAAMDQVAKVAAGRPPVTITLREALHDSPRNSRTEEWLRFAAYLQSIGERVIVLRDTSRADEPLPDFETYPVASRNLQIRLALYSQAKCNFFVSNGPVTLAMFSEAPYVFINEVLDYQDSSNKTESWTLWHGTNPGEQVPWAKPNQRIVWGAETYDVIRAAWDDFVVAHNIAA